MVFTTAAFLTAAALALSPPPPGSIPVAPPPQSHGISVQALAVAEVLRAETATPQNSPQGLQRQLRRQRDGALAVEFQ